MKINNKKHIQNTKKETVKFNNRYTFFIRVTILLNIKK